MDLISFLSTYNTHKSHALGRHLDLDMNIVNLFCQHSQSNTTTALSVNNIGQIPAIEELDYSVWQADLALVYLAARNSENLLGHNFSEWQHIMEWLLWHSCKLSPTIIDLYVDNYYAKEQSMDRDKPSHVASQLKLLLNKLECALHTDDYLVGNQLSIADFAVAGDFFHDSLIEIPLIGFSSVQRWLGNMERLSVW